MLGVPLLGTTSLNLASGEMAFYIISSLLMVVALASVCCLLASLAENKNFTTLLCLGTLAAMLIFGMLLYDRFPEPEFLDGCGMIQIRLCIGIPQISNTSVERSDLCWLFV